MDTEVNNSVFPIGEEELGITKREAYAATALGALIGANPADGPEKCAVRAVAFADALIKELGTAPEEEEESKEEEDQDGE